MHCICALSLLRYQRECDPFFADLSELCISQNLINLGAVNVHLIHSNNTIVTCRSLQELQQQFCCPFPLNTTFTCVIVFLTHTSSNVRGHVKIHFSLGCIQLHRELTLPRPPYAHIMNILASFYCSSYGWSILYSSSSRPELSFLGKHRSKEKRITKHTQRHKGKFCTLHAPSAPHHRAIWSNAI